MDVTEALRRRNSTRAFLPTPIDDEILARVLEAARQSPSWSNTQPWLLAVATGAHTDALRQDMSDAAAREIPGGDYPMGFTYPPVLQQRRRGSGFGLYGVLGIAKDDGAGRAAQFAKNYAFFGAPCVLFLFAHEALGEYAVLDAGIALQSLLLAATEAGLGSCAQAALASFPHVVRRHFDVPEGYKLVCGAALGYASDDVVNTWRPPRAPLSELVLRPRP
jgi:nitroreductase